MGKGSLFYLPSACTVESLNLCSLFQPTSYAFLEELDDLDTVDAPTTSATPAKKQKISKGKQIISEEDLRRKH